jgi:hypothetical protein
MVWSYLGIQQHKIIEKKSNKNNIYLTLSSIEWAHIKKVNDNEINICGKMFDIKTVIIDKSQVVVYGHYDVLEDDLLANAKDLQKKKNDQKKNNVNDNTLFFEEVLFEKLIFITAYKVEKFPLLRESSIFQFYEIDNPPPKTV